ncbi:hypothetical protein GDO81_028594 [Engystomops pustulosus]|uniref:Uncharacterized protein n=1 Tax=Engystomops pustulosus TaxID=76066 RepID=A0AAV6YN27_ENGPU|nr:hypothetical protein GDO81_028594 [Engystomops pustulosus]
MLHAARKMHSYPCSDSNQGVRLSSQQSRRYSPLWPPCQPIIPPYLHGPAVRPASSSILLSGQCFVRIHAQCDGHLRSLPCINFDGDKCTAHAWEF